MITTKIISIEFKRNDYTSGYLIDNQWNVESFIQYDDKSIGFDNWHNISSNKRMIRLIKKAQAVARINNQLKLTVRNIKGTLRIVTDIHGSTI